MLLRAAGLCFSADEFGVLIGGMAVLDDSAVDDWMGNTAYEDYTADDLPVVNFWDTVRRFTTTERSALLKFVHGCPHAPSRGFAFLRGYGGAVHRCTIRRCPAPSPDSEAREAHPRAQTCFNKLNLPGYETRAE